jgi:hypothetical protein
MIENFPFLIHNTHIHAFGVEIDTAIELVLCGIKSHWTPPLLVSDKFILPLTEESLISIKAMQRKASRRFAPARLPLMATLLAT